MQKTNVEKNAVFFLLFHAFNAHFAGHQTLKVKINFPPKKTKKKNLI